VAREAHGGFKSLLASRLRPLPSKATHPPNYRSLHEPPRRRREEGGGRAGRGGGGGGDAGAGAGANDRAFCEDVFDHHERIKNARRTTAAFPPFQGGKGPSGCCPWLREELWHVLVFACTAGGWCGLSQDELQRLYRYTRTLKESTGDASQKPFTDTFKSAKRFVAAVRRCIRSVITLLEWKKVTIDVDCPKYPMFFRDAFDASQEMVVQVEMGDLYWGKKVQAAMDTSTDHPQSMLLQGV